ncbi:MAG TPA: TenA family protein [Dietzia timorensis]|uniref:TenA family protein n=1 Tax=Dietzia timorensis TaxID=499555 RepID=A0A921F206_9ACTN|nr:TenA family protein [Dietzia timorensis]HJE89865.1 TenA family protein [Dietzia timorensis]
MPLFDQLKSANESEWKNYIHHEFVETLGAGTLPLESFQDYLVQDYLFLIQFARAYALSAYKSRSLDEIRLSADGLALILKETELHIGLTERWGIDRPTLESTPEKMGTVAYTRYVLDCGIAGDLLDLEVALAPCTIGYAEIGADLAARFSPAPDHPYVDWITEYAGEDFQQGAQLAIERIDSLAGAQLSDKRQAELSEIFRKATVLESDFWQQALD